MTVNCKGTLIDLTTPRVMGIINVTPDSFFDGGITQGAQDILAQAQKMIGQGATFLDIGGYSSRPGATEVSITEEKDRVLPAIEALVKEFPDAILSIDTFRSSVAKAAIEAGANMINDISGGFADAKMLPLVGELKVPYVAMHMKGTPQTMMEDTSYQNITQEVLHYFSERLAEVRKHGINDCIVDPGFGFSKTREQNFELLNHLELFQQLDVPYLVGISRKSMIYKTLQVTAHEALNGTTALHGIALFKGASILRVHDVKEAVECVQLVQNLSHWDSIFK